jgi:hypothetical protein
MRQRLRGMLPLMTEVRERAQVSMLLRLYEAQRLEAIIAADGPATAPCRYVG